MRILTRLYIVFFCILSVTAVAEDAYEVRMWSGTDTTYYTTFPDALKQANKQDSTTIQLLRDVSFCGKAAAQAIKKIISIDLNGYSIGDTLTSTSLLSLSIDTVRLHVCSSRPGGRIWCTRPYDGRIYAINCTKGQLTLDNVAIEVTNISDTLSKASACGVSIGKTAALQMSDCAVRVSARINAYGVNTYNATTIARCQIEAHADSTSAYGIYINVDTASLIATTAHVEHTLIRVSALQKAYGLQNNGNITLYNDSIRAQTAFNECYACNISKVSAHGDASQCVFLAEAGTITCYGVYTRAGSFTAEHCVCSAVSRMEDYEQVTACATRGAAVGANAAMTLRHCLIDARTTNLPVTKNVCGVSANASAQVVLEDCNIYADGNEATTGVAAGSSSKIHNCSFSVVATGGTAYGANISYSSDTVMALIQRTRFSVSALQKGYGIYTVAPVILQQDTVEVSAVESTSVGLYAKKDSAQYKVSQCAFTTEAGYTNAYGAHIYSGSLNAEDCVFSGTARQDTASAKVADSYARGVHTGTGASLTLTRCSLTARGTHATCAKSAFALYAAEKIDSIHVVDCKLLSQAAVEPAVVSNIDAVGRLSFCGGYYSHDRNLREYIPQGYYLYKHNESAMISAGYPYAIRPMSNPGVPVAQLYHDGVWVKAYNRLEEALDFVQWHEGQYTIVVEASCQLRKGTYYVPDYARLVVACQEQQTSAIGETARHATQKKTAPYAYARLELLDSVTLYVEGMLEVSAYQQVEGMATGTVSGQYGYGHIHLAPTAQIILESLTTAKLNAWGYITGSGMITALSGSTVHEFVQFGDWKGGTLSYSMLNNKQRVFPITHFFYQNIECPITYHYGCKAFGSTYITVSTYEMGYDNIRLIDNTGGALFVMKDGFVRKEYDPLSDRVIWTTNGDVALEELSIKVTGVGSGYNLVSTKYVLPLGSNNTIRALSGTLSVMHDVSLLPGSQVEIAPSATLHIPKQAHLYLYDKEEWGKYGSKRATLVTYSPSWKTCPRDTFPPSARLQVEGRVLVEGALFTTQGGAEVLGNDSGKVVFVNGAAENSIIYQLTGTSTNFHYTAQTAVNAALRNADSTLTYTWNLQPGETFTYTDGYWLSNRTVAPDTIPTGLTEPVQWISGQKIIRNNTLYILSPSGQVYTLLGLPVKKEEL